MKKHRLRYLPMADLDLVEIDETLSQAPVKAAKFFSSLDKQAYLLTKMPFMYPIYDEMPVYRKMVVLDYLVFYTVNEKAATIDVHRIINGRMDVKSRLSVES